MAKKEVKMNAKQKAFAKKQEKEGKNVVKWIFIALIALAVCYLGWVFYLMN